MQTDNTIQLDDIIENGRPTIELEPDEMERFEEINELLEAETISPNVAMNILINAVQVSYDKEHFNDLDRYLIAKALTCFQDYVERNEDILIKVNG